MCPTRNGDETVPHRGGVVDENYMPKRATDLSLLARINTAFLRYSWLISILVGLFIAAGFDWQTPKAQFASIRNEIVENRVAAKAAIDSITRHQNLLDMRSDKVVDILEIFSLDLCLRRKSDPYVYQRLKCDDVIRGYKP
jgi:hypothetical protein